MYESLLAEASADPTMAGVLGLGAAGNGAVLLFVVRELMALGRRLARIEGRLGAKDGEQQQ